MDTIKEILSAGCQRCEVLNKGIAEAYLVKNQLGTELVLIKRGIRTKIDREELAELGRIRENFPVYILRSLNGDNYFSLSEFDGKELQPFVSGSAVLVVSVVNGL